MALRCKPCLDVSGPLLPVSMLRCTPGTGRGCQRVVWGDWCWAGGLAAPLGWTHSPHCRKSPHFRPHRPEWRRGGRQLQLAGHQSHIGSVTEQHSGLQRLAECFVYWKHGHKLVIIDNQASQMCSSVQGQSNTLLFQAAFLEAEVSFVMFSLKELFTSSDKQETNRQQRPQAQSLPLGDNSEGWEAQWKKTYSCWPGNEGGESIFQFILGFLSNHYSVTSSCDYLTWASQKKSFKMFQNYSKTLAFVMRVENVKTQKGSFHNLNNHPNVPFLFPGPVCPSPYPNLHF